MRQCWTGCGRRSDEKLRRARAHRQGLNVREAAMRVKVGKTALYEALKAELV